MRHTIELEHYSDDVSDDAFAELAWPDENDVTVILVGDQASYSHKWSEAGWRVFTGMDIQAIGIAEVVKQLPKKRG